MFCIVHFKYLLLPQSRIMTRKQIGQYLEQQRTEKEISKYSIVQQYKGAESGLTFSQIAAMERGENNYTIDSLLMYLKATQIELLIK